MSGLAQVQGILAGSAVSSWRLKPGNWAGAFACWGLENREAAIRLMPLTVGILPVTHDTTGRPKAFGEG